MTPEKSATLFLKATSEKAMRTLLTKALPGFANEDGELVCYTHQWAVDWNIPIVSTPAVFTNTGKASKAAVMETGFFANVIVHDPKIDVSTLVAKDQTPNNPQRVFG